MSDGEARTIRPGTENCRQKGKPKVKLKDPNFQVRHVQWENKTDAKHLSAILPLMVGRKTVNCVLDTGAQISILSKRVFSQLSGMNLGTVEAVVLYGLNADQKMKGDLLKNLEFTLGGHKFQNDFYVADIADDVILGLDFMVANDAVLHMRRCEIMVRKNRIPFNLVRSGGQQYHTCRVETRKKITVAPGCMTEATVHLKGSVPEGCDVLIPATYQRGLLIPNTIVKSGREAVVRVVNPTRAYHHLKKDTFIGIAEECDICEEQEESSPIVVRTATTKATSDDEDRKLPDHLQDLFTRSTKHLTTEEASAFAEVLIDYEDVFSKDDFDIGCFKDIKCRIDTGDAIPVKENMRRTPIHFESEEEAHLQKMLKAGVIQPSSSAWASCPVLIRKKDGRVRWCIDYRKLNKVTRKDSFPLPRIEQCIDTLAGNWWFSTLDMTSGYWQIEVDERDRDKTAFSTKYGLFEHIRMPFGITNAPAIFQRVVQFMLQGMTWKEILAYLDDVIILGKSFEEHLVNIRKVLQRFRDHNLKLKPKKCAFFQTELLSLGRLVSRNGVQVNPANVEKVKKWPIPKTKNQVEKFLGFVNYHRDHIQGYATISKPLYELTGRRKKFTFTEVHHKAFEKLKQVMTSLPTLHYPDPTLPFVLDTDASGHAIGAELLQFDPKTGEERVIAYGSFSLTPGQRKYCTTRKELLAVIRFTRVFRHFLLGAPFTVRTDHASLTWLLRMRNVEGMLARWLEELSQYDMLIEHRPGRKHGNADGLSRIPEAVPTCEYYEAGVPLQCLPCRGCAYCKKLHEQWAKFEEEVEDVLPLAARRNFAVAAGRSVEELREMQLNDSVCGPILGWLESAVEPEQADLVMQKPAVRRFWRNKVQLRVVNQVLYYSYIDKKTGDERLLLVVPGVMKEEVLRTSHDVPSSGHLGVKKTLHKVQQAFVWFKLKRDVMLYVQTCTQCNRSKKTNYKQKHALGQYHASHPLDKVHIDLLGPFPESKLGHNYILSIVDQFTKWVELVPVKTQTAEEVARAIVDNFITKFGCPIEIFTDQGKCFESHLFAALCEVLNITKTRTTSYHPQSNGQVERFNSVILAMIRCTLGEEKDRWDEKLQQLAMAIRSTVSRTTGFTPNFLMFGRENILPTNLLAGVESSQEKFDGHAEFVQRLIRSMEKAHDLARANIREAQSIQKRDYDMKLREETYQVGDLVYRLNLESKVGESNKLKDIYSGPYVVVKILTPVVTQVQKRDKVLNLHNNNLKRCRDRHIPVWAQRLRDRLLIGDVDVFDEELHIDKLFAEKARRKPAVSKSDSVEGVQVPLAVPVPSNPPVSILSNKCRKPVDTRKKRNKDIRSVPKQVSFKPESTTISGRKSRRPRYLDEYH